MFCFSAATLSSDEDIPEVESEDLDEFFEKPGTLEDIPAGTNCRLLYDFIGDSESMMNVFAGDSVSVVTDCVIGDQWAYVQYGRFECLLYVARGRQTLFFSVAHN